MTDRVAAAERGSVGRKMSILSKSTVHRVSILAALSSTIVTLLALIVMVTLIIVWRPADREIKEMVVHRDSPYAYDEGKSSNLATITWPPPSRTMMGKFRRAAVTSDHQICSGIGRQVLVDGGNSVDAAIATLICVGATNPQSSGIGGGFIMTIFDPRRKEGTECVTINARETAPNAADGDMFKGMEKDKANGYRSVGVPGEIKGFWEAYKKFGSGKVAWKNLLLPTADLCTRGVPVSEYLEHVLRDEKVDPYMAPNSTIRNAFTNQKTGELVREGDLVIRTKLGETLRRLALAENPVELFYEGEIADIIEKEFKENGGLITKEDLDSFPVLVDRKPLISPKLRSGLRMCGPKPPSSFAVTQMIVALIDELYYAPNKSLLYESSQFYHNLLEAQKFAYGLRTEIGDVGDASSGMDPEVRKVVEMVYNMTSSKYIKQISKLIGNTARDDPDFYGPKTSMVSDHGTSHVSIVDESGLAVSCTSTVNLWLGSKVMSPELGIIWNDQMDDFSILSETNNNFGFVPSKSNLIEPGRRPVSSMSPTVVFDPRSKEAKMVVGTTGGSKIIQGVSTAIIRAMLFGETVKEAIDAPNIYHQYTPFFTQYEADFPKVLRDLLVNVHKQELHPQENMNSVTHAIKKGGDGYWYANSDKRSPVATAPDGY